MAVYASLVSLKTVIDHVQQRPRPPVSLDQEQVESVCTNITFLQEFLEKYPHRVIKRAAAGLENKIAEVAYAAEDVIESHIVDHILGESTSDAKEIGAMDQLYQSLQKVAHDFESLKEEVEQIKKTTLVQDHHLLPHLMVGSSISRPQNVHMVGFDDVLLEVLDKLTGHELTLQIIPIVGMGGIGKTTLAKNAFENQLIVEHFQCRSWATVSQVYNARNVLSEIFSYQKDKDISGKDLSQMSEQELGESLHKILWGRKYLVILDDMWSIEVWDSVKRYLPDNNNGSRIMISSRISNIAHQLGDSHLLKLGLLDEKNSWDLLCKNVFGEEICPDELKEVGREIAKNCKGLPLSIAVISGLLVRSPRTRENWEYVAQNLAQKVNEEDDKRCLKILRLSYNHLPIHLKPCFLYLGIYPEDSHIKVSTLTKLWVAEGFLNPKSGDSLKVVAKEYLTELIDRNLILSSVKLLGFTGNARYCQMHDLLRDLCIRIGVKEKFIHVLRKNNLDALQGLDAPRRIVYNRLKSERDAWPELLCAFQSSSGATRSLIADVDGDLPEEIPFRLLRVLSLGDSSYVPGRSVRCPLWVIVGLVNSRFIGVELTGMKVALSIPPSLGLVWNLRTIRIYGGQDDCFEMPSKVWMMPQLEHVIITRSFYLPDPPESEEYGLWNLQTLSVVQHFKFSEEIVERIPNIRKLEILFSKDGGSDYCMSMSNVGRLLKLETLSFDHKFCVSNNQDGLLQGLSLLNFLKKLRLRGTELDWEDITRVIGSLPCLEVLRLLSSSTKGSVWNLEEGKFSRLKYLRIYDCYTLQHWTAESTHFPCLEQIDLYNATKLEEIPMGIGDVPTLRLIKVHCCEASAKESAMKIKEEQEGLGNFDLEVKFGK